MMPGGRGRGPDEEGEIAPGVHRDGERYIRGTDTGRERETSMKKRERERERERERDREKERGRER